MSIWWKILIVLFSGGVGAVCRLLIEIWLRPKMQGIWFGFPTVVINTLGCLIMGVCAGIAVKAYAGDYAKTVFALITMTGFCGGFSTFSEFTLDCLRYADEGKFAMWFIFGAVTIVLGLAGCFTGYYLVRTYWP